MGGVGGEGAGLAAVVVKMVVSEAATMTAVVREVSEYCKTGHASTLLMETCI